MSESTIKVFRKLFQYLEGLVEFKAKLPKALGIPCTHMPKLTRETIEVNGKISAEFIFPNFVPLEVEACSRVLESEKRETGVNKIN